jgi:anti-sigma factor RsiW
MNTPMNTPIDKLQVHAFVDGELDLKSQLDFETRLREDPALRTQVEHLHTLRATLREAADYHSAPAALRKRLLTLTASVPAAPAQRGPGVAEAVRRWLGWRPMVASLGAATVLAVSLNLAYLHSMRDERVLDGVVASHVRSTVGEHLVDIASSDKHTVKPWLSSKLGFSPPVSEPQLPGSTFLGGRVDYVDGRPVAALAYRQGQHVVNSFVWPNEGQDRPVVFSEQRGFQVAHWSRAGMARWVISDLGREPFETVVRAIEAADALR